MQLHFLGSPPQGSPVAAVIPVPFDATSSYGTGARNGPEALLYASAQVETWMPELNADLLGWPVETQDAVDVDLSDLAATVHGAGARVADTLARGLVPFCIGGDHSISSGPVGAVTAAHGPLQLLQIDAHLDLRDAYLGQPYSHASVMRRCHADHDALIVPVGIRSGSDECWAYAKKHNIRAFTARELDRRPRAEWIAEVVEGLSASGRPVYVTVDLDGFDPSVLPDTGTPEPGGLAWYDVLDLFDQVAASCTVVGADITELLPGSQARRSAFMAARLLAYMLPRFVPKP